MTPENNAAREYLARLIATKQKWRVDQARLSVHEKLAILDKLKAASDAFASRRTLHAARNVDQT
jgi:hypothetical protein